MDVDTRTDERVAALNIHRILDRAAGMSVTAPGGRKEGRAKAGRAAQSGTRRTPKAR